MKAEKLLSKTSTKQFHLDQKCVMLVNKNSFKVHLQKRPSFIKKTKNKITINRLRIEEKVVTKEQSAATEL